MSAIMQLGNLRMTFKKAFNLSLYSYALKFRSSSSIGRGVLKLDVRFFLKCRI